MRDVILLGTHFMFREELGSRLRGIGYVVHPFDSKEDLLDRLNRENYNPILVIIDLQYQPAGGLDTVSLLKQMGKTVLAIGEHKSTEDLQKARNLGTDKVIINSQASQSIEIYVNELVQN